MAGWNGSGVFTLPYSWTADAAAGIDILASRMDTQEATISSQGFGNTLTRDGQGQPTANLPMAGFRHTGAAAAVSSGDYVTLGQLESGQNISAFQATGTPSIATVPIGQGGLTIDVTGAVNATTGAAAAHEFGFSSNFVNNLGGTTWNKVAIYGAIEASGTVAGNSWAANFLAQFDVGSASGGQGQITELDMVQNTGTTYSAGIIAGGLVQPALIGQQITGLGTHAASCGQAFLGTTTDTPAGLWQIGIGFYNDSTNIAAVVDANSSTYSYVIQGTKGVGIDAAGPTTTGVPAVFTTAFMRAGSQQKTVVRTADNSADMIVWESTGTDELLLGDTPANGMAAIYANTVVAPTADNTVSLGASGHRWTEVWAATGTINTSDPSLKTDVTPLSKLTDAQLDGVISAIQPVMFRWIVGGQEWVDVEEEMDVQAMQTVTETVRRIEVRNGVAREIVTEETREEPLWDWLPVVDENGDPVVTQLQMQGALEPMTVPKRHRVPRMERRRVRTKVLRDRAGRRMHAGFMAPEVKTAINDALGTDFAGWVLAEDGTQALRHDQLVPFLWEKMRRMIGGGK